MLMVTPANEDLLRASNRRVQRIACEPAVMEGEHKLQMVVDGRIYVEIAGKLPGPDPPKLRSPEDHTVRIATGDGKDLPLSEQPRGLCGLLFCGLPFQRERRVPGNAPLGK